MASIKTQLRELLDALHFGGGGADGERAKVVNGNRLAVDFAKGHIDYGGIECGDGTTANFSQAENAVVFECVHRLLEKGYHPRDITLENRWKLGRGAKGGKADILVRGNDGKTLLTIECKTWGAEFDREQKRMRATGGQLFSYLQQDKNAKYLCLYASQTTAARGLEYKNAIVKIEDRDEDIQARKKDETVKLYRDANTMVELHEVWKERFNLYFHYNGIFEGDVGAYEIELKPLKKRNLLPFAEADGVFNQFAEILRHNNISDNANAFNRILSLLLCKMVDEEKGDDEVLGFQVMEGGADTPEIIHDRLQNLYHKGMKQYLRESVVYHSDKDIADIIATYPDQTPLEKIERMFREIKYYTNNEFAFKEVHNRELFVQNGRVLNEVIKMLQNYQFKHTKKQQILGDFFELLLNHGVKQSEGQFFTPVPIVRFILLSIGLERIIGQKLAAGEGRFLPKILDYACGAGHFLTESIDELQGHLERMPDRVNGNPRQARAINKMRDRYRESTEWAKDYIFGVEKDYRLARTAQIACFINGDGDANIIFGDGLEDHDRLRAAGKFDLIVANPPYSVKAFKNYLRVPKDKYRLFDKLTESAGEIQVFFLERAAQMLAIGGIAGIIMPASILANGGIDAAARRLMLERFEVKALAEFGGATFSATSTNTVVLFLRRRPDCFAIDRGYIAKDLFGGKARPRERDFIDSNKLLEGFAEQKRGLPLAEYQTLIAKAPSDAVQKSDWFGDYRQSIGAKHAQTEEAFLAEVLKQEKDKFYVYMLCMGDGYDSQEVVAVNSGDNLETQKAFLGYSHSKRKGKEGAKKAPDAEGKHGGKMYDEADRQNPRRASSHIRAHLWGDAPPDIDNSLKTHVKRARLADCLNFDGIPFIAAINAKTARAAPRQEVFDDYRWPTVQLGGKIRTITPPFKFRKTEFGAEGKFPIIDQSQNEIAGWTDDESALVRDLPVVVFGLHTCRVKYVDTPFAQGAHGIKILTATGDLMPKFLYYWLQHKPVITTGEYKIYFDELKRQRVPLPPLDIQRKIAGECDAIDRSADVARKERMRLRATIDAAIGVASRGRVADLAALSPETTNPHETPEVGFRYIGLEHIESNTGKLLRREEVPGSALKSAKRLFKKGDVLYGKLRPYLNKVHIAEFDGVCSTDILVLKTEEPLFVKYALLHESFVKAASGAMRGINLPRVSPAHFMNVQIPLPPADKREAINAKILATDRRIAELDAEIGTVQERKSAVLKKYL